MRRSLGSFLPGSKSGVSTTGYHKKIDGLPDFVSGPRGFQRGLTVTVTSVQSESLPE